jgi:methyltransferase family protein
LIIALDLSEGELRRNRQLADKIVADVAAHGFPFRDGSVDLVTSRSAQRVRICPEKAWIS